MKDQYLFLIVAGLFLFFINTFAFAMPMLPTMIQGTATINNVSVSDNIIISVMINGIIVKTTNTTDDGTYIIAIKGNETTVGKEITFYVDGIKSDKNTTWASGKVETIDLAVTKINYDYLYALISAIVALVVFFILRKKK